MLISYLEEDDLIEWVDGEPVSKFEYEDPEARDPNGVFDFILQTIVDFGSDDMGGRHVLELNPNEELFDYYSKIQKLNVSSLKDDLMQRYGFELDDQYSFDGFHSGNTCLGNSLNYMVSQMDYDGVLDTHKGKEYSKGFTAEQITGVIESLERTENREY